MNSEMDSAETHPEAAVDANLESSPCAKHPQILKELLQTAQALHIAGQLLKARTHYQEIIDSQPDNADALHGLGVVSYQLGKKEEALALIGKAIQANPNNMEFRKNHDLITAAYEKTKILVCPPYLEPEVFDKANQRVVKRYFPQEANSFIYIIEIVGTCNLRCPTCPVGNFSGAVRPKGFMALQLFKQIVEKIKKESVSSPPLIWLFNWGEPLLHPHIEEILHILKINNLPVMLSSNLNIKKNLKEIIRSGVESFKISVSGFSHQSYAMTHVRGNIDLVKDNMRLIRQYLDEFKVNTNVWVGHHIYKNNLHEIPLMRTFVESLGFTYSPIPAFYQPQEKVMELMNDEKSINPKIIENLLIDPVRMAAIRKKYLNNELDCELRFNMTTINFDGSVALCCSVYDQENMLGINFLDKTHSEIQEMKYSHQFCKQCYAAGLQYSKPSYAYQTEIASILNLEYPQWNLRS